MNFDPIVARSLAPRFQDFHEYITWLIFLKNEPAFRHPFVDRDEAQPHWATSFQIATDIDCILANRKGRHRLLRQTGARIGSLTGQELGKNSGLKKNYLPA